MNRFSQAPSANTAALTSNGHRSAHGRPWRARNMRRPGYQRVLQSSPERPIHEIDPAIPVPVPVPVADRVKRSVKADGPAANTAAARTH